MHKKLLIFLMAALILLSAIQPVSAARAGELRLQATKTFVSGSIDSAINSLNNMNNIVDRSALKDIQKAGLKSQIQENITWFEKKNADIKASTGVPGVLAYAREASDRWDSVYPGLKKKIGLMSCDNVNETIATARKASEVVAGKVSALKAQGKDTSALSAGLASYNGHIDSAAQHVSSARSEFDAIGTARLDGHYAAGFRQLTLAGNELKYSYNDLKKIYRLIYGNSVKVS